MDVIVTKRARAEITDVVAYRAARNISSGRQLLDRFIRRFEELGQFPLMGRSRSDLQPGLRALLVEHYIAFYLVEDEQITVVRVIDGRMDLEEELRK
jgi:toxin ParE1/3/4